MSLDTRFKNFGTGVESEKLTPATSAAQHCHFALSEVCHVVFVSRQNVRPCRQGYHFVLVSKICTYFQDQCLKKYKCA